MKVIVKGKEPSSLIEHRANQPAFYENLPKDDTRSSLLKEQGHICCYCMRRIPESGKIPGSKIEHFLCQDHNKEHELNYSNMLLACTGNEGSPEHLHTCDTKKKNLSLKYSPCSVMNIEGLIKYKANGEIYSNDEVFNEELEKILNLNVLQLKENRKNIFELIQSRIRNNVKQQKTNSLKKSYLESEKRKLLNLTDGKFSEYCMVGVYVIDQKLKKLNK